MLNLNVYKNGSKKSVLLVGLILYNSGKEVLMFITLKKIALQLALQQDMLSQILAIVRNLVSRTVVDQTTLPEGLQVNYVEDITQLNDALADEGISLHW